MQFGPLASLDSCADYREHACVDEAWEIVAHLGALAGLASLAIGIPLALIGEKRLRRAEKRSERAEARAEEALGVERLRRGAAFRAGVLLENARNEWFARRGTDRELMQQALLAPKSVTLTPEQAMAHFREVPVRIVPKSDVDREALLLLEDAEGVERVVLESDEALVYFTVSPDEVEHSMAPPEHVAQYHEVYRAAATSLAPQPDDE
ncbi:MAG: hypothetical protein SangKO_086770 [Sandaracinaceae bacterium]